MVEQVEISEEEIKFLDDVNNKEYMGLKNPETNFWYLQSGKRKLPGEFTSRHALYKEVVAISKRVQPKKKD
jgi:hypothetical protein